MAPLMETPATRREAIASLLAMLAFVLGANESAAADVQADSVDDFEPVEHVEQPCPSSSVNWGAQMHLFANDEHLPLPRNLDVMANLVFDGETIRMDLEIESYPAWKDGVEIPPLPLGSFVFTGNPAAFFDEISSDADGEWLKKQQTWAERPSTFCPECLGINDRRPSCETCKGRGWLALTPAEGRRMVQEEFGKRQALLDAAWADQEPCDWWEA